MVYANEDEKGGFGFKKKSAPMARSSF